jgi:hypothetical protein
VIAITGVLSGLASYNPFKRGIAPGPEVQDMLQVFQYILHKHKP